MKLKRITAIIMAGVMMASLAGCASGKQAAQTSSTPSESSAASQEAPKESSKEEAQAPAGASEISLMNSKPELEEAWKAAAKLYEETTGVKVNVKSTDKPGEEIATKYAAGDPATLMLCDYPNVTDMATEKFLDLSGEKWVADGGDGLGVKVDGKLYGFPFCVEGTGILYNKTAIEKIIGKDFVPDDYKTLDQFTALLDELVAGGMEGPIVLNSEDWSIGQHFIQYTYRMQTGKREDAQKFLADVKAGTASFADNAVYNSVYDTLDVFIKYNINKKDPLAATVDLNAAFLAEGETAFWMNGSWGWPQVKESADEASTYGIMPLPVNGDFTSVGKLNANATKFLVIDRVKATPEQQQAAKDFLNWLVYDAAGQDVLVNQCAIVPAFKNITLPMSNGFNEGVKSYADKGLTNEYVPLPSEHRSSLAAFMQEYLAGKLDRKAMAQHLDEFWKTH